MLKLTKKRGFTLPEVLIGIAVLGVAILTVTNIFVSVSRGNSANMNDLTAYYLASEGVEAVRNIRDTHWYNNIEWTGDKEFQFWGEAIDFSSKGQYIVSRKLTTELANSTLKGEKDIANDQKIAAIRNNAPWLITNITDVNSNKTRLMHIGGQYIHNEHLTTFGKNTTSQASNFSRYVEVEPVEDKAKTIKVKSVVKWEQTDGPRQIIVETILTDWKSGPK